MTGRLDPDQCVRCGLPAVAGGLCHHDAEHALTAAHALITVLDTTADLTDPTVRRHWVHAVQARMADVADRLNMLKDLTRRKDAA